MTNLQQIRPTNLDQFQGKLNLKKNLKIYIKTALEKNQSLDHCLFYGPAGVGKTTLAKVIANELQQKIKIVQGYEIEHKNDLVNLVYSLSNNQILFIDEIHTINHKCYEMFYSMMEDFVINIEIGKDFNKKMCEIKVPHFTLIGATTRLGNLPNPFEERFGIVFNLSEYKTEEIVDILKFNLSSLLINSINEQVLIDIAKRSKGIPRIAKRLLKRYMDFYHQNPNENIQCFFERLEIYEKGLNQLDIEYLKTLNKASGKIGIKTLAQILNIDEKTILEKIEPYLVKNGWIEKGLQGRHITKSGAAFLDKIKNSNI